MAAIKEWFGLYNVIFNWIENKYGYSALEDYWEFIAKSCCEEAVEKVSRDGLEGIKQYYEHTFDLDQAGYSSKYEEGNLVFEISKCPDYEFMNSSGNVHFKPVKNYCRHHEVINNFIAEQCGLSFSMPHCGNHGTCRWVFGKKLEEGRDKL